MTRPTQKRIAIGKEMLKAVEDLIDNRSDTPMQLTKMFWAVFPEFANEYITGTIDFVTDGSTVDIHFTP